MRKAWLKFWFNDYTRVLGVLFGGHLLITGPWMYLILSLCGVPEYTGGALLFLYAKILLWAMLDNDYSKLDNL